MPKEQKIIYEPHPVTPKRKAELRAQGYKIIDAVFAPANHQHPGLNEAPGEALRIDGPTVAEFVERGYLAANYPPTGYASRSTPEEVAAAVAAQASTTTEPATTEDPTALRVAKGPGGRIYIKRGKDIHSGPFEDEAVAEAALAAEQKQG